MPSPTASFILLTASTADFTPVFSGTSSDSVSFTVIAPSLIVDKRPGFFSEAALHPLNPEIAFATFTERSAPQDVTQQTSSLGLVSLTVSGGLLGGFDFVLWWSSSSQQLTGCDGGIVFTWGWVLFTFMLRFDADVF